MLLGKLQNSVTQRLERSGIEEVTAKQKEKSLEAQSSSHVQVGIRCSRRIRVPCIHSAPVVESLIERHVNRITKRQKSQNRGLHTKNKDKI